MKTTWSIEEISRQVHRLTFYNVRAGWVVGQFENVNFSSSIFPDCR
jgi:hypothetical protein